MSDSMVLGGWTHLEQSRTGKEKQKQEEKQGSSSETFKVPSGLGQT